MKSLNLQRPEAKGQVSFIQGENQNCSDLEAGLTKWSLPLRSRRFREWRIRKSRKGHLENLMTYVQVSSVQFSCSVMSDSLRPHGRQRARPPCPSPPPGAHSNSCPLSRWCHPTISSSVVPFSSRLQSLPPSESFPMSQFFASGGQSIGVSASTSVLPVNTQDCLRSIGVVLENKTLGHS